MWERSHLARLGYAPDELPTIHLFVDFKESGEPAYEEVPAVWLDTDIWRPMATPGLVWDVAAGDVLRVGADGRFELLERGGNVAVQVYTRQPEDEVGRLIEEVGARGGWLDGYMPGSLAIFTFPMSAGFARIHEVFDGYGRRHDEEWYYGNVYDDQDQPLKWWA
jgi:hypothetical protein